MAKEYAGVEDLPSWVTDGAKVKVKRTAETKKHGVSTDGGGFAVAGDSGKVERFGGAGWWDWRVRFSDGATLRIDDESIEYLEQRGLW